MTVAFCGHRNIANPEIVKEWLRQVVDQLIDNGADTFYLGGYGQFDSLAASIIYDLKQQYPLIRSVLVLPYLDRQYSLESYDETLYPPIETVPRRFAILKRNEYMIKESDIVVAYVQYSYGGAYTAWQYAKRKGKTIIDYPSICPSLSS